MAMNKVVGENLYIGGMSALSGRKALKEAGITHVVSVLRLPLDKTLFDNYHHKVIEVDDFEDQNLLEHFTACNKFISRALRAGGAVLIHCAMGKSRSATILAAYLMASRHIAPNLALRIIERTRPIINPNRGFMKQLGLYYEMKYATVIEDHPLYQQWVCLGGVEVGSARKVLERVHFRDAEAEIGKITQVTEEEVPIEKRGIELRCKKCCQILSTSASLTPHLPKPTQPHEPPLQCSHHFIEPLLWMEPEFSKGEISGNLECPKCKSKVGTYAWQGLKCSCGGWVVPGISVARGEVGEIEVRL